MRDFNSFVFTISISVSSHANLPPLPEDNCKAQFVDCLMKTYTSEAVFLLTTFVNMARSRPGDSEDERCFINTISVEIFEVCLSVCLSLCIMYVNRGA